MLLPLQMFAMVLIAVYTSTTIASAAEFLTDVAGTCAYSMFAMYSPTAASGTQTFTLYYDSATATAASALVMAGVASMFF